MNWEAIGSVGESISALAVLVTLIYLAIQVRHTRRAQQAEAIRSNRVERRDYHTTLRESPYMPMIFSKQVRGEKLNEEEGYRLLHHNTATWGLWYSEWIQTQLQWRGPYGTSLDNSFVYLFAEPYALAFFEEHGRKIYPEEFVNYVQGLLDDYNAQAGI
jgi:hypothetical protein